MGKRERMLYRPPLGGELSYGVHSGRCRRRHQGDSLAEPGLGSGLYGLWDRVAAAGGTLTVESPAAGGTRACAELPCE